MADSIFGIDVSYAQGDIDWTRVATSGVKFAMIRAGYGMESDQVDSYFYKNIQGAQAAGIKCGIYWYSYALSVEDAEQEAEVCYETIKDYSLDYPVAFDIEDSSQQNLSSSMWSAITDTFCSKILEKGYHPAIYSFKSALENKIDQEILDKYDVWLAHWVSETDYSKSDYTMWQYGTESIDGIEGEVDADYSYKDYSSSNNQNSSKEIAAVSSYFIHPLKENNAIPFSTHSDHNGSAIDFACAEGTKIYSMSNGEVVKITDENEYPSMGNAIIIRATGTDYTGPDDPENIYFRYLHLSEVKVEESQTILAGDLIGLSGNTGDSSGPHLHIDLLQGLWGNSDYVSLPLSKFKSEAVKGYLNVPQNYSDPQDQIIEDESDGNSYLKAIFAQKLQSAALTNSQASDGSIILTFNDDTLNNDTFKNQYFHKSFTNDFMGYPPSSIEADGKELTWSDMKNCPTFILTLFAMHEFGGGGGGSFSYASNTPQYQTALMSAKMWRCRIMAPPGAVPSYHDHLIDYLESEYFVAYGDETGFNSMMSLYSKTEDFINFSQLIYLNFKNPNVYGIEDNSDVVAGTSRFYAMAAGYNDNQTAKGAPTYGLMDETYNPVYYFVEELIGNYQAWFIRYCLPSDSEPQVAEFSSQMETFS